MRESKDRGGEHRDVDSLSGETGSPEEAIWERGIRVLPGIVDLPEHR